VVILLGFSWSLARGAIVQSSFSNNTSQTYFPCNSNDLINAGQATISHTTYSPYVMWGSNPGSLTNGDLGLPSSEAGSVGSDYGWEETFFLDTSVNINGYSITNISVFGGWTGGRASQGWELSLAFQGDSSPGTFYSYGRYGLVYNPGGDMSTKIELTDTTGVMASNVCAIRFAFYNGNPAQSQNGDKYREIDVFGVPSPGAARGRQWPPYTVYVATNGSHTAPFDSWTKAATNVQAAVDVASNALVLVSNGTYDVADAIAIVDATVLRSVNGAADTILRRSSGTTRILTVTGGATIDGFTIRDGNNLGVYMNSGVIRNCLILGNSCGGKGGGILMDTGSGGIVQNCTIAGNSGVDGAGVEIAIGIGWPLRRVENCIITNNTASRWGGGVGTEETRLGALIRNCLIAKNSAGQAGGGVSGYQNNTGWGVGIENCTIASNTAGPGGANAGGGVWLGTLNSLGFMAVTNSIICFNRKSDGSSNNIVSGGFTPIAYSCSPDLTNGVNGNITANPLFLDPAHGNFRLATASPCINTGTNVAWMSDALDLDGGRRLRGIVDLGAYESAAQRTLLIIR
jgi:hypothetical protein